MSRILGIDLSPFALRSCLLQNDGTVEDLATLYSPKGCARSEEYESAERWDDPMAFRGRSFGECFEINNVEKTVDYIKPNVASRQWLGSYKRQIVEQVGTMHDVQIIGTLPDHATPDEKDNLLHGLGHGAKLLWRPVAIALQWLKDKRSQGEELRNRKLIVIDLDGGLPEVTQLELARHETYANEIVPVRTRPRRHQRLKNNNFNRMCYKLVMNGVEESEQLVEGQFGAEVQKALESGENRFNAWVRHDAAWSEKTVEFAPDIPSKVMREIQTMFRGLVRDGKCTVLCVGWFARRYKEQFERTIGEMLGSDDVCVMGADTVCQGAAEFGRRLEAGLPTYYDSLPKYRWWDSKRAEWKDLFSHYQRVEPGQTYEFPGRGDPTCRLEIDKYNDNVSMYIQVQTEDDRYEDDEVYAHRLKINFAEYLKESVTISLTASISPDEGSACFTITAQEPIFQIGDSRSRLATLHYSEDPDAAKYSSVQIVHEHEGYLEPQPILGRIYDNEAYVEMVDQYILEPEGAETNRLKEEYFENCNGSGPFLAKRFGYSEYRMLRQPTRGLFGSKRVPDMRIDSVSSHFARFECGRYWHNSRQHSYDWYTALNYCFGWAPDEYKDHIRMHMKTNMKPEAKSFYYAPGYVFGDKKDDIDLFFRYYQTNGFTREQHSRIWWSVFRLFCWHEKVQLLPEHMELACGFLKRCVRAYSYFINRNLLFSVQDKQYLLLAMLFVLTIRRQGCDFPTDVIELTRNLIRSGLDNIPFPKTMINNLNGSRQLPGDNLSKYVMRFLMRQDTLQDRELGAAMGGV